ncbi:YkvA family protein, partial [Sinorhizobium meliloti]|uniref:YkvA family protein n=1 Tax=Rhizobium meliloti TaxID=382 RepID=UPI000FE002AF
MNVRVAKKAKIWAKSVKRDTVALWIAARDRRTPVTARLVAGAIAAYALSPMDLIPGFIPVLGYLDEVILLRKRDFPRTLTPAISTDRLGVWNRIWSGGGSLCE